MTQLICDQLASHINVCVCVCSFSSVIFNLTQMRNVLDVMLVLFKYFNTLMCIALLANPCL